MRYYQYKALRDRYGRETGKITKVTATQEKWRSIICRNADKKVVIAPLQFLENSPPLSTKHPGS